MCGPLLHPLVWGLDLTALQLTFSCQKMVKMVYTYLVILLTVLLFPTAPNRPLRNLSGVSPSSRRIYLTWHPPPAALTNGIIREYYANVTDTVTGEVQLLSSQSEVLEITNLHPYYTYKVAVAAYTVALGPFTDQITVQTLEDGALLQR